MTSDSIQIDLLLGDTSTLLKSACAHTVVRLTSKAGAAESRYTERN